MKFAYTSLELVTSKPKIFKKKKNEYSDALVSS